MQRRKKPMKSPFVITFSVAAAASLAVACGGKVPSNDSSFGSSGSSGSSSSSGSSGSNPPVPPPNTCTVGAPCSPAGAECNDPTTDSLLFCENGTWQYDLPHPPVAPSCPETVPAEGSACFVVGGPPCLYVDGCDTRPTTAPPDSSFACVGSAWQRVSASYAAACPAAPPNQGDSCAACAGHYPANCTYPSATGCPGPAISCDVTTLTWSVSASSCNPPVPPDAGAGGM